MSYVNQTGCANYDFHDGINMIKFKPVCTNEFLDFYDKINESKRISAHNIDVELNKLLLEDTDDFDSNISRVDSEEEQIFKQTKIEVSMNLNPTRVLNPTENFPSPYAEKIFSYECKGIPTMVTMMPENVELNQNEEGAKKYQTRAIDHFYSELFHEFNNHIKYLLNDLESSIVYSEHENLIINESKYEESKERNTRLEIKILDPMTMVSEESDNLFEPSKHKKASVKKSSGFGRIPMSKHYVRIVSNGFAILFTEKGFGSHIKVREIITKYKEIFGLKDTTDEILCSLKEYVTKISVGRLLSQEKRAHNTRSSVSQI